MHYLGYGALCLHLHLASLAPALKHVRSMIVDEANILRTTIIKADFFPDSVRDAYRMELRKYLEERISYYEDADDHSQIYQEQGRICQKRRELYGT